MSIQITSKGYFSDIDQFYFPKDCRLGLGSFGTVQLALHKQTQKKYAIKIIDLKTLTSESQLAIIQRQIKLHSQLDHPHIIRLWDTLSDESRIYMVLEYASNGSLFHHQNSLGKFSEKEAFRFFNQTLKAIEYLHENNIMHRDLKPQNLLLDNEFNIKVCDFGWATQQITEKRTTFCGTYEYMAPQMANQEPYDYRIDIWAVGILLYQLTHGYAPFKASGLDQIKDKIKIGVYEIDNNLSKELRVLIMKILQFVAQNRPSIKEIVSDIWIKNMIQQFVEYFNSECQKENSKPIKKNSQKNLKSHLAAKNNNYTKQHNTSATNLKHKRYQSSNLQISDKELNVEAPSSARKKQFKKLNSKKCKTQSQQSILKLTSSVKSKLSSNFGINFKNQGRKHSGQKQKLIDFLKKSHDKRKKTSGILGAFSDVLEKPHHIYHTQIEGFKKKKVSKANQSHKRIKAFN